MRVAKWFALLFCLLIRPALAAPLEDLASPDPEVRAAAAKVLRETFTPPPASNWDPQLNQLRLGISKKECESFLKPWNAKLETVAVSGTLMLQGYRVDGVWMVLCRFQNPGTGYQLTEVSLREDYQHFRVDPPATFSGLWTNYFVNGYPSCKVECKDGKYFGIYTGFGQTAPSRTFSTTVPRELTAKG